ncbi:NAD(P)-dependent dehydrogenase (short-subunit alcohol dehydrogenase family) [Neorhizobium alkalisoli]|uniref:NAD(P)-dependent dehydrogenase (Short-subunit alcohol dehydrogenase family) n=2 Tax=Neorhizobium alkalisoli TaxID=528178 RepID=A0A561R988_9HYPH|nr:NAD(P)-dependent dehydrogenase (short-subunit alcohol dehydrogenase family) [Neorhizobium alkalisoli]
MSVAMSSGYTKESVRQRGGALVTGGAAGIGAATAIRLADEGFDVTVASLEEMASLPPEIRYVQADVTRIETHDALVRMIQRPVALVNCAGITSTARGDMLELAPESFDRVMDVNVRATFFLTQAFARHMIAVGSAEDYRSIIFVGSINSEVVGENRADYCMSKAAVTMMSKLYAARLASQGIVTHEIRPGIIRTGMTAPATEKYDRLIADGGVPMSRWGEPEDVARAICALARGDFPYATATVTEIAGGLQLHRV